MNIGLSPKLIKWFKSYLTGRSFIVKANNVRSSKGYIYKGVPQGSSLEPLLFALFINDLPTLCDHLGVKTLLYADDVKLYRLINKFDDSRILQAGIDLLN